MYHFFKLRSLATAALLLLATAANAQHLTLFETFTNECYPVISGVDTRAQFEQNVANTVSSKQTKVILMNYHYGNICDIADYHLSNGLVARLWPGGTDQIFWGSVDRATLANSTRHSSNPSDWAAKIDADAGAAAVANLSLADIKIDTTTLAPTDDIIQTDVAVTLNKTIDDSLILRFAVLQNNYPDRYNVADSGSSPNKLVNDVVRYLTFADTGSFCVFPPGSTSGTTKHVVTRFVLPSAASTAYAVPWDYQTNRLIGFLEENPNADFHVVNATTLKTGMTGLAQPDPFLAINSASIDDQTYNVGDQTASFQWSGLQTRLIDVYLSTDNGSTWMVIDTVGTGATGFPSLAFFTVPNTPTTEAKIKITRHGDQLSAVESGTFTIQAGAYVSWIKPNPNPNKPDSALAKSTYMLQWAKDGVNAVTIRYSVHTIGLPKWDTVRRNFTGTSAPMTLPDTAAFLDFQIIPTQGEAPSQLTQLMVYRKQSTGGVAQTPVATDFTLRDLYPNPASGGKKLVLDVTSETPKALTIEMLDLLGHAVYSQTLMSEPLLQIVIPTAQLEAGTYFVRLADGEQAITKRIEILK